MKSSLDVLSTATGRTVAVMGDMYELGDKENELHYNTGAHAAEIGIDVICCIGELSHHAYEGAKACAKSSAVLYFKTKQDFLGKIRNVVKKMIPFWSKLPTVWNFLRSLMYSDRCSFKRGKT